MNLLIALKLGINKSVKNNLLGNEMNTGNTTLSSVGYATTPLLLGRYSLTLSTPLGIYSLDTVNSVGEHALLRRDFVNRLGMRIHDLASGSCDLQPKIHVCLGGITRFEFTVRD